MAVTLFRTIILYLLIIAAVRIMGKRQIGELQPSELVVTILIAELAAIPMQDNGIPIMYGVISILALLSCEMLLSYFSLKSLKFRIFLEGCPSIIIDKGIVNQKEMARLKYTIDDLTEELRLNGADSIDKVKTAIMETNGKLSVFLKDDIKPVTPKDLNIQVSISEIPIPLISDGRLISKNLKNATVTEQWIKDRLFESGIIDIKSVFFMCVDKKQKTLIIPMEKNE